MTVDVAAATVARAEDDVSHPVGVLFVHGIGSQPQSATLREFGQELIDWLKAWHGAHGAALTIASADLSYGGDLVGPARVRLEVPSYTGPKKTDPALPSVTWPSRNWVLAEAWWSSRLVAPEYGRMLRWSARILARTVGQLAGQTALRARALVERLLGKPGPVATSDIGQFGVFIELFGTLLLTLEYFVAGFVGYLVLVILLPVSYVPIEAVREFVLVRLVRPFLVDNVGDFETFIEDDVQALNIRHSIERALTHLTATEGCQSIIVVAHSQGALVAFDALCSRGRSGFPEVTKLITFGGAINKGLLLKPDAPRLQVSLPDHIFWLDVWAYYDPVPGGQLVGPQSDPKLVHPSDDVRERFHWFADQGDGPMARRTVNRMSVLSDHGGYWNNWEHFTQRVAQEIDLPRGYYHDSRFYNVDEKERSRHRRVRIATLVGWRLAAMYLFLIAAIARAGHGGLEQLTNDGRTVADFVGRIPGAQLLSFPGELLSGIGTAVHLIAAPLTPTAASSGLVGWLAARVEPTQYAAPALSVLALATIAGTFALLYGALTALVFSRWDEGERRISVGTTATYRPRVLLRTLAVVAPLVLLGYVVAWP